MPNPRKPDERARAILDQYIAGGEILPETFLRYRARDGAVVIEHIVVSRSRRRKGIARRFLTELKAAGVNADISLPRTRSLPFWEAMFHEGLIPHNPHEYTTWENA